MIDLGNYLNPSQYAAVTTIDGPLLVIAGAGSGKTRVIEYRVLFLVENGISPQSILLLTFTRRAAREMLERAGKHNSRCNDVEGGTFHSFALRVLRKYAKSIGFNDSFSILDEGDAEEAIDTCCAKLGFYDKKKRFPRKDTLRKIISASINKNITVETILRREYPHFSEHAPDIENLMKEYARYKINRNYLDYDDLLLYLKLLLDDAKIRNILSSKYQFVMVDEYQDTNKLQGDITYLLAERHKNVMVVGDDAQSIYGFRGASHENIMEFPSKFPGCKIIKLEANYRSTQSILDLANAVQENMKNKYTKCLFSARNQIGVKPCLLFFKDAYEEAEYIANEIKELRDGGIPLSRQAVLFRAAYISIPLQAELNRRNIPYQIFGGLKLSETAHIKDVLAHLKVILNPKDELAWNRVLKLITGIGPKTCERILEDIMVCAGFEEIIENLFQKYINRGYKYAEGLVKLTTALMAVHKSLSVGEQFNIILEYYKPILQNRFDDWHLRLNDLETLRQIAARYSSLEELLADFAIEPPEGSVEAILAAQHEEEKPLTLSTIHSAKGLEWDVVFIIGIMDGVLPISFAIDDEKELEEEHRLFYVAITRAKDMLFLSLHHEGISGGINKFNKISRFVDAPNVLSKLDLKGITTSTKEPRITSSEVEVEKPIYDKKSLLRKIIDFLDKKS
ncbi:MAG: ATP-dependent helicase [Nitrososphaerales archaeon]